MTVSLCLAPAGLGKTQFALNLVREASRDLRACPRVCVANRQQVIGWRRRLLQDGGSIGIHVQTFDELFAAFLQETGQTYLLIDDIVQYRLLSDVAASLPLDHFARVRALPGFIQELQRIIGELKSAHIEPDAFLDGVRAMGDAPRLREIGLIYEQYQQQLRSKELTDYRGLGWLAVEALQEGVDGVATSWGLLVLDGFASFTETQLIFLRLLRKHIDRMVFTLTGDWETSRPRAVHRHFDRTRQRVEASLGTRAQPLGDSDDPVRGTHLGGPLALAGDLFQNQEPRAEICAEDIELVAAPDHAAEVRVALRWLKARIVVDGLEPQETALVARDIEPYRPFIAQIAAEYGLPIRFVQGPLLEKNPCVAALLALLRMLRPATDSNGVYRPVLPRRNFLDALRSPYFDWECLCADASRTDSGAAGSDPLTQDDVETLDAVSRWGQIISGAEQWWAALDRLARIDQNDKSSIPRDDEGAQLAPHLPYGKRATRLRRLIGQLLARLQPPQGRQSRASFLQWLERLLGPDTAHAEALAPEGSLNLLACVKAGPPDIARRDFAALNTFRDVLRGILRAEQIGFASDPLTFTQFLDEVTGAVEATRYMESSAETQETVMVSDVTQTRGVPCRALAIMGLAEGLFPAILTEDPFLTESDRQRLRTEHSLPLDSAIESFEQDYFYETVARSRERLLLTRPVQAESGATWEPSPFWTEVQRLCHLGERPPHLYAGEAQAASRVEILDLIAAAGTKPDHALAEEPWLHTGWKRLERAAAIVSARWEGRPSPFDGWLVEDTATMQQRFGATYGWSASRLESYLACPLNFFLSAVLRLEARPEPQEGLDARQLGNIYHRILEETYKRLPLSHRTTPERVRQSMEAATERVLDEAPRREGFREASWWPQTKDEIRRNVAQSVQKLLELPGDFVPTHFERTFGASQALRVEREGDHFLLRGIIDRIDVDEKGRLRLIDYKTAGPYGYDAAAHRDGKRLQLPFYALAVEHALQLGAVVDGFYWHVQHAEPSRFSLKAYGAQDAIQTAVDHAWRTIERVRQGQFKPQPPDGGCPDYCPGVSFCWQYRPRRSF